MTKIKSMLMPAMAMLTIPLFGLLYGLLNHNENGAYSLMTDLDRGMPFIKAFVVPYLFWYLYLLLGLLYLSKVNRRGFYLTILIYDLGLIASSSIYFLFQTHVPRPILVGDDWLTHMISFVYQMDQPYNCFPSTHVFTTYLLMKSIHEHSRNSILKLAVHIVGISIILSTVLIKQHVILDIIGAILLVELLYRAVQFVAKEGIIKWAKKESSSSMMRKRYET